MFSDKDDMLLPIRHFFAIDQNENQIKTQKALDEWYNSEQKDYEVFSKKYPINGKLNRNSLKIKEMKDWCYAESITHTPTIFINGYQMPKEYAIEFPFPDGVDEVFVLLDSLVLVFRTFLIFWWIPPNKPKPERK